MQSLLSLICFLDCAHSQLLAQSRVFRTLFKIPFTTVCTSYKRPNPGVRTDALLDFGSMADLCMSVLSVAVPGHDSCSVPPTLQHIDLLLVSNVRLQRGSGGAAGRRRVRSLAGSTWMQ